MVEEVLPRASRLAEPAVANVDHVLLVFSAAMPAFQVRAGCVRGMRAQLGSAHHVGGLL